MSELTEMQEASASQELEQAKAAGRRGLLVNERYRLEELIRYDGSGSLYRARDLKIGKPCSFRILAEIYSQDEEISERFMEETRRLIELKQPNLVDVIEVGLLPEDRSVYMVAEWLDGVSVATILRQERHVAVQRAVHIATQICRALMTAHQASIIHRDLKPESIILIAREGDLDFVKVIDFGICKQVMDSDSQAFSVLTGSPDYMSPEQAVGAEANATSDIYALGCILFEMLTGELPYQGPSSINVLVQKSAQAAPLITSIQPDLPEPLAKIVARCLERRSEERYASAQELEDDLLTLTQPQGTSKVEEEDLSSQTALQVDAPKGNSPEVRSSPTRQSHDKITNRDFLLFMLIGTISVVLALYYMHPQLFEDWQHKISRMWSGNP